jgi:hypothetical protein
MKPTGQDACRQLTALIFGQQTAVAVCSSMKRGLALKDRSANAQNRLIFQTDRHNHQWTAAILSR